MNKPEFVINVSTGKKLINYINNISNALTKSEIQQKIIECMTIQELTRLYQNNLDLAKSLEQEFVNKKNLLNNLITNISSNGNGTYPHTR